jgi:4-alpha-glucanotransferase
MESARAKAIVIGEDLGTVEPGFRDELAQAGVLSTRVVWFEDDPPERYPHQALAMVTTHDLPTLAGEWTGADGRELEALGRPRPQGAVEEVDHRLARLAGSAADAEGAAIAVHAHLGRSPAAVVLATLEDVVGATARPNLPGTTDERPNWSVALPLAVDDLPVPSSVLGAIAAGRAD